MKKKTIIVAVVVIVVVLGSLLALALNNNLLFFSSTKSSSNVGIQYNGYTSKTIPVTIAGITVKQQANEFMTFLQVSTAIENRGYESFSTNPSYFSVVVDKVRYSADTTTLALIGNWKTVDILNGGTTTGVLIFQVPDYVQNFTLSYDNPSSHYNIIWEQPLNITSLD